MDRAVAAVAGMASTLYLLAAIVAWGRVISPRAELMFSGVFFDRAVAWTSLCVLFATIATLKLQMTEWGDTTVDAFMLLALAAVYVSGMMSVRHISQRRFPVGGPVLFGSVTVAVGLLVWML